MMYLRPETVNLENVMKTRRYWLTTLLLLLFVGQGAAQQVIFPTLRSLVEGKGDTVDVLKVERRSKNQIYLLGGADYKIEAPTDEALTKYMKRCYAIQIDTVIYMHCRKMRYKKYRFGGWFAPGMWVGKNIYYCAQPLGQAASSTVAPEVTTKLAGEVGDAINASGLVKERVFYELDTSTGRSVFVGKERMHELLDGHPDLQAALAQERSEEATVIGRYLWKLKSLTPASHTFSVLGDSYSTFAGHLKPETNAAWYGTGPKDNDVKQVEDTWWMRLANEHGLVLDTNNSYSGSTVCLTGYRGEDFSDRAFVTRIHNVGKPDILLLFGGTNDSWAGVPIGDYQYAKWQERDLYAFRPAFCYLLHNLRQLYPATRIYNITNTELSEEVTESMEVICRHYGVRNIRLHDIDKQQGHPSVEGMKRICEQVWEALKE